MTSFLSAAIGDACPESPAAAVAAPPLSQASSIAPFNPDAVLYTSQQENLRALIVINSGKHNSSAAATAALTQLQRLRSSSLSSASAATASAAAAGALFAGYAIVANRPG